MVPTITQHDVRTLYLALKLEALADTCVLGAAAIASCYGPCKGVLSPFTDTSSWPRSRSAQEPRKQTSLLRSLSRIAVPTESTSTPPIYMLCASPSVVLINVVIDAGTQVPLVPAADIVTDVRVVAAAAVCNEGTVVPMWGILRMGNDGTM